jgi:lysophospholipase L1-like esterase
MKGYPDGTFRPMQPITRAEAVIVLHRSMLEGQKPIHIAALGDSLTAGFGDETNIGYVHRLGKELRARTHLPIYVRANFAVVGQKTTDVLEMLEDTEKNMKAHTILKQANIIVMTIGGNDIYRLGEPLDVAVVSARMPTARERVKKILTNVRTINPTAHITYVGLYNPFDASASKLIQQWNDAIAQRVEDKNMTVVSDIFPNDITPYLAWDKYHLKGKFIKKTQIPLGIRIPY